MPAAAGGVQVAEVRVPDHEGLVADLRSPTLASRALLASERPKDPNRPTHTPKPAADLPRKKHPERHLHGALTTLVSDSPRRGAPRAHHADVREDVVEVAAHRDQPAHARPPRKARCRSFQILLQGVVSVSGSLPPLLARSTPGGVQDVCECSRVVYRGLQSSGGPASWHGVAPSSPASGVPGRAPKTIFR